MKIEKGHVGYLNARKKKYGMQAAVEFAVVLAILILGYVKTGTKLNIFTVVAIVGCLPASKALVEFITMFPYHSLTQLRARNLERNGEYLTKIYDMVLTSKEAVMPVEAIVVSNNTVFGYAPSQKVDLTATANYIKSTLAANQVKANVKLFSEYKAFVSRVEGLNNMRAVDQNIDEELEQMIKEIILTTSM